MRDRIMAERQERFHSVVDLLDAFFGGSWTGESVNQLSRDEMYSLAEDVNSFYSEFRLPHRGGVHSRGRLSWAVAPGLISGDRVGVSA